jgi:hypothetical protein
MKYVTLLVACLGIFFLVYGLYLIGMFVNTNNSGATDVQVMSCFLAGCSMVFLAFFLVAWTDHTQRSEDRSRRLWASAVGFLFSVVLLTIFLTSY